MEYGNLELRQVVANGNIALMLEWNRQDPVSESEIHRNEEAFKIQGNRNIFIDYPEIAESIWG